MDRDLWSLVKDGEFCVRSHLVGGTFVAINALTKYNIIHQERVAEAEALSQEEGVGLLSFSNHISLFDDPLVLLALRNMRYLTTETKRWWSTACASNFNPRGKGIGSRMVRLFSDVSNMIFMERAYKEGNRYRNVDFSSLFNDRLKDLLPRIDADLAAQGRSRTDLCRSLITPFDGPDATKVMGLNQAGVMEACLRLKYGQWCHVFPEGGRSRDTRLRKGKMGVGKMALHTAGTVLLPFVIAGTEKLLPIGAVLPRPLQKVDVIVGQPQRLPRELAALPPTLGSYQRVTNWMMEILADLSLELKGQRQTMGPARDAVLRRPHPWIPLPRLTRRAHQRQRS